MADRDRSNRIKLMRIQMRTKCFITIIFITLISILLSACQTRWQMEILINEEPAISVESEVVNFYINELDYVTEQLPMAYILYHYGFTLIDEITFHESEDSHHTYDWETIAEIATIAENGQVTINSQSYIPNAINITPSPLVEEIEWSIMDLAPTIAQVIGLPSLADAHGQPRSSSDAKHGVLILMDGLQFQNLQTLVTKGSLPFFQAIDEIHKGLTVFPSITTASTAALLTGAPPYVNGVYGYGYRSTKMETIFDLAVEHGRTVTAIEGYGLAFNLRNANMILSGDRDGDGFTDDNVLANSLDVIKGDMPDLLFIHFHDVDDMGHRYGPETPEYEGAIIRVDNYLSQIYEVLPSNTFVIIFADHGMQAEPNGIGGNHGSLTKASMIFPIIFLEK